jgi:trehalose synthase
VTTTPTPLEVPLATLDPRRLEPYIGPERMAAFLTAAERARSVLGDRTILNVNSTAAGGGVAEMLHTLLAYARGTGLRTRWLVIRGNPAFFAVTKRIHNGLYGGAGDGGELGDRERAIYEQTLRDSARELQGQATAGDVWVLHDPQPAGLVPMLRDAGVRVVWRCHVGRDEPNELTDRSWAFLRPYVERADAFVFSRDVFAPPWVDRARLHVIAPSIDPFTPKNAELPPDRVRSILAGAGILAGEGEHVRPATVVRSGPPPRPDEPLVVQVSRWDPMKDMPGVLAGFAEHVDAGLGAHLVLAGPSTEGVVDDPEASEVLVRTRGEWERLPPPIRARVHLVELPMADMVENGMVVNAIQRHAAVVTQKSLAEGFGLTVVEAMFKERPVVGTAVGGIVDQIVDGESGLLVADPHDLQAFGGAVERLLLDTRLAEHLAANGRRRAVGNFLADRHLAQYGLLLDSLP